MIPLILEWESARLFNQKNQLFKIGVTILKSVKSQII